MSDSEMSEQPHVEVALPSVTMVLVRDILSQCDGECPYIFRRLR